LMASFGELVLVPITILWLRPLSPPFSVATVFAPLPKQRDRTGKALSAISGNPRPSDFANAMPASLD